MAALSPQVLPSLLMPSIDLMSPAPPRIPSRHSKPVPDDHWDTIYASPAEYYTPTAGTRGFTPRRTCSPYGSPSNPFRYHTRAYAGQSPVTGIISSRAPVDPHKAIQRITAAGITPWSTAPRRMRTDSERCETRSDEVRFVETMMQVVFWAAVVILFSALLGVGEKAQPVEVITTRAWSRHVPATSGLAGMGWKGVGMVDRADGLAPSGIGRGIQGIWDDEAGS